MSYLEAIAESQRMYMEELMDRSNVVMTADLRAILSCAEAWLELFPTEDLEPVERESLALVLKAVKEVQR